MSKFRILTSLIFAFSGTALIAQDGPPPLPVGPPVPTEPAEPVDMDAVSYIIGSDLGQKLKMNNVEANMEVLIEGIKEAFAGGEPKYSPEDTQKIMTAFQNELQAKMQKKQAEMAEKNATLSEEFLAENGKKEGIVTTASGLQYQVIKEGDGPKPTATDKVKAIYKGELINGTVFDDSRGLPREFPVGGVVQGWQEALPLMATGSKWKLFVPPGLGYGPSQRGPVIEPNSVLVFEIELVEISKPAVAVTPPVAVPLTPGPKKERITAVTPPVSVPLPPKKEEATEEKGE